MEFTNPIKVDDLQFLHIYHIKVSSPPAIYRGRMSGNTQQLGGGESYYVSVEFDKMFEYDGDEWVPSASKKFNVSPFVEFYAEEA